MMGKGAPFHCLSLQAGLRAPAIVQQIIQTQNQCFAGGVSAIVQLTFWFFETLPIPRFIACKIKG
jgi:hypothetical protein